MDVKPMCPYCGMEMRLEYYNDGISFACHNCWSESPFVRFRGGEDVRNLCYEAAMRRPAQKPLTWEEIPDHKLIFMELRGIDKPIPSILRQTMDNQAWYTMESGCVFTFDMDELGKRWRPWEREPTEEERAAAPWEGVGDADL
jgi:hypothetical protein